MSPRRVLRADDACPQSDRDGFHASWRRGGISVADYLLAIDQGTTSTRAIVFDAALKPVASAQQEFPQIYPAPGLGRARPGGDLGDHASRPCARRWRRPARGAATSPAIGITNQRETTIVWDRATGKPIHNAIVWQDRRTADACAALRAPGHEARCRGAHRAAARSLFLGHQDRLAARQCRRRARGGARRAGSPSARSTAFCSGGSPAARCTRPTPPMRRARCCSTSAAARGTTSCASCSACRAALLPEVRDCAGDFGTTAPELFGGPIRILGVAGDQQAATVGQGCFTPGMMKSTYGTGCFALLNTGDDAGRVAQPAAHHHRLSARRQAHLCARRRDLHRRRRGAMAARRAQADRDRGRRERARRGGRSGRAGLSGAGLRRARRAVVGRGGARRDLRADPQFRRRRDRARRARSGRLPDPRPARGDARRLAGARPTRCCASTAA